MARDVTTLEVRAKFADLGITTFVKGKGFWEGDHLRLVLTVSDIKGITRKQVSEILPNIIKFIIDELG